MLRPHMTQFVLHCQPLHDLDCLRGRARFRTDRRADAVVDRGAIVANFVDHTYYKQGYVNEKYPLP